MPRRPPLVLGLGLPLELLVRRFDLDSLVVDQNLHGIARRRIVCSRGQPHRFLDRGARRLRFDRPCGLGWKLTT